MDAAVEYYRPGTKRFNIRVIVFASLVLGVVGFLLYTFLSQFLTGGVIDHGSYEEVNLKAMGHFYFDGVHGTIDDVPARYRALDGKRVQLEGQVFDPVDAGDKITNFEFVYSITKCCFNGPPLVQERVFVRTPPGRPLDRPANMARLTGILHVKILHDNTGNVSAVYTLDAEKMEAL